MAFNLPRDMNGKFMSRICPDPNCGGAFQQEGDGSCRCDGLTHITDSGPLFACKNTIETPFRQRDFYNWQLSQQLVHVELSA